MRVFTASLGTETNSFSPIPTTLESFQGNVWHPAGTYPESSHMTTAQVPVLRAMARERGWTLIEGLCTFASPAGTTSRETYETLRDHILAEVEAAMPLDMVVLGLHGAMIAEGYGSCEGDLLARVRAIVGPGVPIGAELDLHCHITPALVESADILVGYKEFPHIDHAERARELVELTAAAAERRIRPVMSVFDCRMIVSAPTSRQPMRGFVDRIKAMEGRDGILSVSLCHCFPYGDVEEIGARVLVIGDGEEAGGKALAERLGREFYAMRRELAPPYHTIDEALDHALARGGGPFVLAEPADNPGGGAPCDHTGILHAMLDRGVEGAALGPIWDPQAVGFCHGFGKGATVRLRFGGKAGVGSGRPVDAEATILETVQDHRQSFAGLTVPLGDSAAVRVGGIDVLLVSNRKQAMAPDMFSGCGIDPLAKRLLVVKSTNHFHAAFAPIAKEVLYLDSDGPLPRDYRRVPYTRINRDLFPFHPDPLGLD